ncbi:mannosyltransferase complex subunit [Schizosaccharomyces japonicus yFS275]|uniref:Mannosyltransferase complex subunit n=1 Tax=Schizosaccharomyces japonicus (strain yFS275 / FY16936) TaxID=402676 RepID=B6K399_SCHJY|nr:mannosyltransferase complex subunit [Schizosaccharomyces japonicus yFS275]EEB07956.1 mannosyltransferase complex subunit [Schizosaccharomyces japonicus yFS275]
MDRPVSRLLRTKFLLLWFTIVALLFLGHTYWKNTHWYYLKKLRPVTENHDAPFYKGCKNVHEEATLHPRMNATFMVLTRNSELDGVISSMKNIEQRFNRHFNYPYTFLNDEPFTEHFKQTVSKYTNSKVEFGVIAPELWDYPPTVDREWVKEVMEEQTSVVYASMPSYHKMCHFFSGTFFQHPLIQKYEWYWRLEPDVTFSCDISYDPFYYMQKHNKVYGFVIAIRELAETVPNLFRYTLAHKKKYNLNTTDMWEFFLDMSYSDTVEKLKEEQKGKSVYVLPEPPLEELDGQQYNMCHFWSNFEIARVDFFQSQAYMDYINTLEEAGGFWAERWGDAPVHSLAAGLLLSKSQVHYFRDLGYQHSTIQHCGQEYGCNCDCPYDVPEIETKDGSCTKEWARIMGGFLD